MLELFPAPRIHRTVDQGMVQCPVRLHALDVERCLPCPFLADVTGEAGGAIEEIVCKPPLNAVATADD